MRLLRDRSPQVDAELPFSGVWQGWAAVDNLNALFHDVAPAGSGIGYQLVDAAGPHLPAEGQAWEPCVDFKAAYREAWGR
jgi:hypothetical protein